MMKLIMNRIFILTALLIFLAFGVIVNAEINQSVSNNYENNNCDYIINKIQELTNNDLSADELIKTTYPDRILKHLSNNVNELFEKTPPECVRISENKEVAYFIYKSDTGHYFLWLYSLKENNKFAMAKWYFGKPIYLNEFKELKDKKAKLNQVKILDPDGSYVTGYMGSTTNMYTYHHSIDGYLIRFDYCGQKISDIKIYKGKENIFDYYLLPKDSMLIFKKNNDIKLYINGKKVQTSNEIFLDSATDSLMIPLSDISNIFKNIGIKFIADTETVVLTKDNTELIFTNGATYMIKNNEKIFMNGTVDIKNGRICIPLTEFSNGFGFKIEWMQNIKTISLQTN